VQPSFFSEWNNWCVSASKQLKWGIGLSWKE
jgi:hypothetical protein